MRCNHKNFIGMAALALAVALFLPQLVLGAEADGGSDHAIQTFVSALNRRDPNGVLAAFSQTTPWQLIIYDITNPRRIIERKTVTYGQMARDFQIHRGWYADFIKDPEGWESIGDTIRGMSKWYKNGNTFSNGSEKYIFYIKWRPAGGRWVIGEIGYSPP
jgi:hypothetical protein